MKQPTLSSPIITFLSIVSLFGFFLVPANGAEAVRAQQWEITADKITRYEEPPSVIAEGNVLLEKIESVTRQKKKSPASAWGSLLEEEADEATGTDGEQESSTKTLTTIKADWVDYDVDLGTVKARGNLLIDVGPDKLAAESGTVDLNRETGVFENASIIRAYKDLHLEGKVIEKTGDLTYHIEDGWIISCKLKEGETPPWSFAAADTRITDGGYAVLKHATFRIKDVPVLYTPIMMLPVKRSRQTGFLFPSLSTSDRDGFGVELPFFINLSPSSDATLYPQYLANRGFMSGGEFRYVLDQNSKGVVMGNHLDDDLSDPSEVEYYQEGNYTHTNRDRYWVRGKADQDILNWTTRLDLDLVSDRDYLTEFNSGPTGFSASHDSFMEVFGRGFQNKTDDLRQNSFRALRSWSNGMALSGEFLGIDDLRETTAGSNGLWKLPSLDFTGLLPLYKTGIDFAWDADYVNYWRETGVGAQRLDLFPRLSMAVPLSPYLETTVNAGIRETAYLIDDNGDPDWSDSDSENRFLANFGADIGTTMARDFAVSIGNVTGWSHTFRPSISYQFVSDDDQANLPQFDSIDNIGDQNTIYYGLDNFFSVFGSKGGSSFEREYGYIKILQGYDLRSEESDTPLTPVNVKIGYYPLPDFRLIYRTDVDVYGDGVTFYSIEGDYVNSRGDLLSADYRYNAADNTNSLRADARVRLRHNLSAAYSIERSLEDSITFLENFSIIYQPSCWSVELASHYTPGNQQYLLMFRLANLGTPLDLDLPGI